jgi:rubrerythrin
MSKSVLEVQFLRATDEEAIETYTAQKLQKRIQEGDPGYMYTMARQIASWDGETDGLTILARVERMIAGDAMALRDAIEDNECGVDTDLEVLCPKCGHINELSMPITADFFRPRRSKHDRHS